MSLAQHHSRTHPIKLKRYTRFRLLSPNRIEGLFSIILGVAVILYPSANSYNNAFLGLVAGFCVIWTGLHLMLEQRASPFAFGFSVCVRAAHASLVLYDIFRVWDAARGVLVILVFGSVFISLAWKLSQQKD